MDAPVLIWGAGAMGGTIGAHLVREEHRVLFVDRVPEHVDAETLRAAFGRRNDLEITSRTRPPRP